MRIVFGSLLGSWIVTGRTLLVGWGFAWTSSSASFFFLFFDSDVLVLSSADFLFLGMASTEA
jgi:hypothetical protein